MSFVLNVDQLPLQIYKVQWKAKVVENFLNFGIELEVEALREFLESRFKKSLCR